MAFYAGRKPNLRILCGSIQLLLGRVRFGEKGAALENNADIGLEDQPMALLHTGSRMVLAVLDPSRVDRNGHFRDSGNSLVYHRHFWAGSLGDTFNLSHR